jgi:ATP-dependent Zn protease
MLLGGRMAEELYIGNVSGGARDDLNKFNALVDEYFNSGMDTIYLVNDSEYRNEIKVSEKTLEEIEGRKKDFIDYVSGFTKKILEENETKIRSIVEMLLEKEDLYEEDIKNFL